MVVKDNQRKLTGKIILTTLNQYTKIKYVYKIFTLVLIII